MEQSFVLVLVGLTSVGAYLVGAKWLGLSRAGLRKAIGRTLECAGMTLGFFVVNVVAGMVVILVARVLTREFVSLYYANDVSLLVLSFFQGLTFLWWRRA
jgi:hypothetical protein